MRLEHHLVGGYVRYISPHIIIIITMEFCAYILPRPIEIRALLGAVSTEFCGKQRHEIGLRRSDVTL